MGAWGMLPWDSDDFGDTFQSVADKVGETIYQQLHKNFVRLSKPSEWEPMEGWTAIGMVIWGFNTGALSGNHLRLCLNMAGEVLDRLESDHEWISSWRNPHAFQKYLAEVREELESADDEPPLLPGALGELFTKQSTPRVPRRRR